MAGPFPLLSMPVPRAPFTRRLCLIALAGLVLRLLYVLFIARGTPLTGDARYYHEAANLIADGLGFTEPYRYLHGGAQEYLFVDDPSLIAATANTALPVGHIEPTAGHPPLWVLILGFSSLLGVTGVLGHQLVSACVGVAGIVLVGLLGREVGGERTGLMAGGFAAGYAFLWLNDGSIMSESLVVALVAASTLVALRLHEGRPRSMILFGVLAGLAALTRAELLLFIPFALLPLLLDRSRTPSERLRRVAAVGLVALLVMSPWLVRNLSRFEEPVFLSNGSGVLLAQTNCDATYFGDKVGYWEHLCVLPQPIGDDGATLDESERDAVWRQRGLDYAAAHKGRLITHVVPRRVARLWALNDPVDQLRADVLVEGRPFRASVVGLVQYAMLMPAAIAGAFLLRRRRRPLLPLLAWPAIATFVAAFTMGTTRYRVSAEAAIVVLAAVAADALLVRWRDRRTTPTG
ncbi:MAG: glycosyltransferase family 39 protein [Actinobacteria bacterium]|nr:glycosyltransferase family 39 protein [Actinomycetota bacterium]